MSEALLLPGLAALNIWDGNTLYHGGDQEWYLDNWQRKAGCGPTNCTNLLWFLAKTRKGCALLCEYDATQKEKFIQLMEEVWQHVTPGNMGVNTTAIFVDGAVEFAEDRGVSLRADTLEIASIYKGKRNEEEVQRFIAKALGRNLPVAFLNLSNGKLTNLDSWHWVTITALRGNEAMIFDQGEAKWVDLHLWLETSMLGGGFVTLEQA